MAELVIIPTGLSRLAGQAIRLVRRLRLSLSCLILCGWGCQAAAQVVASPTCVSAQHGRDSLTRAAPAMRATGVAGCGRAVPGLRATPCPLAAFSRARHRKQAKSDWHRRSFRSGAVLAEGVRMWQRCHNGHSIVVTSRGLASVHARRHRSDAERRSRGWLGRMPAQFEERCRRSRRVASATQQPPAQAVAVGRDRGRCRIPYPRTERHSSPPRNDLGTRNRGSSFGTWRAARR